MMKKLSIVVLLLGLMSTSVFAIENELDPKIDPAAGIEQAYRQLTGDFSEIKYTSETELSCYLPENHGGGTFEPLEAQMFEMRVAKILHQSRPELSGKIFRKAERQLVQAVTNTISVQVRDNTGHLFSTRRCITLGETNVLIQKLNP